MVRPTVSDLNPNEFKYYPFMIILNKWTGSCNALSPGICVPKEAKDIFVKAFNVITNKDEAKDMTEHISCDCKCKYNSVTCNWKQKWNNKTWQCECKHYQKCEKDYSLNPSICMCENNKYFKSVANTSVTKSDKIVIFMNNLSTKKTNTISTYVTTTTLINCHSIKVRDCYIFNTVLLVVIVLLIIVSICCYLIKYW